ncbi:hypothetical protein BJX70DRAFT_213800 [Aspergillus crustosus]
MSSMADSRRRQFHSCDPCRKGKRGCDAPENRAEAYFESCSNCKKWKKECTFNWLSTNPTLKAKSGQEKKKRTNAKTSAMIADISTDSATPDDSIGIPSIGSDLGMSVDGLASAQWLPVGSVDEALDFRSSLSFLPDSSIERSNGTDPYAHSWSVPEMSLASDWQVSAIPSEPFEFELPSTSSPFDNPFDIIPPGDEFQDNQQHPAEFCIASDHVAKAIAQSTMTRNLMRIYHDSMENALSCWLTEHNCPYTDSVSDLLLLSNQRTEWGPDWSNRMCIRVCQLDRAAFSLRGRALSAEEDRTAARVLRLAIVAFASQWSQHAHRGVALSVPSGIDQDERSIRKNVWDEARHALEHSTRVPSFRVIFANIIFSLTQTPLDKDSRRGEGLGQLLENDSAPIFLEAANRQLYIFRHKLTKLHRSAASNPQQVDPILSNPDHQSTLSLLFWLGIMFDTLSAAMYQRPLVVSDEDSQIASISPRAAPTPINLDCWDIPESDSQSTTLAVRQKRDVWGDFFLRAQHPPELPQPHCNANRWPCTYATAASTLSSATPVKVLLYRRITQLQTLIYRGSSASTLESAVKSTLSVYNHWQATYAPFMNDCVANHAILPSRIQSWYVILDGHWHLATLLLADVLEEIDTTGLGLESAKGARIDSDFVEKIRRENALSVGALARASLQGRNVLMEGQYHDCVSEVAFLVEPWTVVLVNCFARGGYVSVQRAGTSGSGADAQVFRVNCEFCISALEYLGRKSDMAFLVAKDLRRLIDQAQVYT